MDAKITKSRLGLLLSYDWIKIIAICVAAVLVWALLYTMLATRATNGQRFEIYSYLNVRMDSSALGDLEEMREKKALSEDVLDFSTYTLNQEGYEDMILQAHFAAGQGDVMFAPNLSSTTDSDGNVTYAGLTDFLASLPYERGMAGRRRIFGRAGTYCTRRVISRNAKNIWADFSKTRRGRADFAEGTLDKAAAEANYRARIKGGQALQERSAAPGGLEKEYGRLEALRASYVKVLDWVSNDSSEDPIELCTVTVTGQDENGQEQTADWTYAFDLSNLEELTKFVSRPAQEGEIEGVAAGTYISDNYTYIYCGGSAGEEDMRYEPITFLTYLADTFDKKEA